MSARLLMVEDERNVAETLMERLRSAGYEVVRAESVLAARRAIAEGGAFQLALLDVGLPDGNGFELARLLRERAPATAIIFLTAHASPEDRVRGLELGADDYMGKPFHFRELLLRVQNCLKRAQDLAQLPGEMRQVHIGRALVDFERFCATVDGETHSLTHKECSVLRLLAERVGKAVSRDEILDRAWSADEFPTSRTVDNFIVRLRKLVEADPADPRVIRSIRGVGYLLTELHRE